ncbi:28116_t:CDS:2, partial [Gigaspora margarita]
RNQKLERLQAQLEQKERENQQNYQEQKNYLELTANLAKSPNIRVFFTDLLRNYAEKFAENKILRLMDYLAQNVAIFSEIILIKKLKYALDPLTGDRLYKNLFLNDPRDPIEYNPVFREYFIRLNNFSNIITFAYCPWCGDKLPTSLRESYFDILKKEHNIKTNLGEYKQRSDIPPEFRTDE